MSHIIKTNKVCRRFQSGNEIINAVKDIDLHINKGELLILRGPSGSGKTTLLNLLGALDIPSSGKVFFMGKEISKWSESERDSLRREKIGFVFQTIGLISIMSAYENIDFGLRINGYSEIKRRERAEKCLHLVGMYKRRNHLPFELSGGEQQRVAIARAMAHNPEIIFADEPTSALDTNLGLQVIKLFKNLVNEQGLTVVMTTHDPNIMDIADRVYSLEDGKII